MNTLTWQLALMDLSECSLFRYLKFSFLLSSKGGKETTDDMTNRLYNLHAILRRLTKEDTS